MRLHRFYINFKINPNEKVVLKNPELFHQLSNVFRYSEGDLIIIFDGTDFEYQAKIEKLSLNTIELTCINKNNPDRSVKRSAFLCLSLTKKDTFEIVAQKATELGIKKIIPIISERSEKKDLNLDRLKKIIIEASEQSGRLDVPEILEPIKLYDYLDSVSNKIIVFDPRGVELNHQDDFIFLKDDFSIFIGPEGGFSPKELEFFIEKGNKCIVRSLGKNILRSETAGIVCTAVSIVL